MTLSEIKDILVAWFENHLQVASVQYGKTYSMLYNGGHDQYPLVNLRWVNGGPGVNNRMVNNIFEVTIAGLGDRSNPDITQESFSDFLQIAEDFKTFIGEVENGLTLASSGSVNPFTEARGDGTDGIVFTVTIGTNRPLNPCAIPTKV